MYSRCGRLLDAWKLFDTIPYRNVVSWTSMITGCVQNDAACQALPFFKELLIEEIDNEDVSLDHVVLVSVMSLFVAPETHLGAQTAHPQPPGPTQAYHLPPQRLRTRRLHHQPFPRPPDPHPKSAVKAVWRVRCKEVVTASKWS
ncbi:hypothetical protein ACFX10_028550 [Malus domestica]